MDAPCNEVSEYRAGVGCTEEAEGGRVWVGIGSNVLADDEEEEDGLKAYEGETACNARRIRHDANWILVGVIWLDTQGVIDIVSMSRMEQQGHDIGELLVSLLAEDFIFRFATTNN